MDEATAYKWIGQIFNGIDGKVFEVHVRQTLADKIASALVEAYKAGQQESMTDKELRAFLDLLMVSDPWPVCDKHGVVDLNSQVILIALADREAGKSGRDFLDWIDAHHYFMKPGAIVGPTPKNQRVPGI